MYISYFTTTNTSNDEASIVASLHRVLCCFRSVKVAAWLSTERTLGRSNFGCRTLDGPMADQDLDVDPVTFGGFGGGKDHQILFQITN